MAKIKTAKRYAKALFEIALDTNTLDRVGDDLGSLISIIEGSVDLAHFLQDPLLSIDRKTAIFSTLLKDSLDPLTFRFILFLIEKKRIGLLQECCAAFDELFYQHKGILKVFIVSAKELNPSQLDSINSKLKAKFQKEIESHVSINSSLLGGFKIIVGDHVLDFSLECQLQKIKQNIING